jgi:hypothetical protein
VTGHLDPVVAGLVKIQTGLRQVSVAAYLKQAAEIFDGREVATEAVTHPETFIRVQALSLWKEQDTEANPVISRMIERSRTPDDLDLVGQVHWKRMTRRFLEILLKPKWMQTPAVLGHARLFFDDFQPTERGSADQLEFPEVPDAKMREYFFYVMLDFVTVDAELEDLPLAFALELSRRLQWDAEFEKLAARELGRKLREVRKLKHEAAELLSKVEVENV